MLHFIGQAMLIADRMEHRYDSDRTPQDHTLAGHDRRRDRGWTGFWLGLPGLGR